MVRCFIFWPNFLPGGSGHDWHSCRRDCTGLLYLLFQVPGEITSFAYADCIYIACLYFPSLSFPWAIASVYRSFGNSPHCRWLGNYTNENPRVSSAPGCSNDRVFVFSSRRKRGMAFYPSSNDGRDKACHRVCQEPSLKRRQAVSLLRVRDAIRVLQRTAFYRTDGHHSWDKIEGGLEALQRGFRQASRQRESLDSFLAHL